MLTFDEMKIEVRHDGMIVLQFRNEKGYGGFSFYEKVDPLCEFLAGDRSVLRDGPTVAMANLETVTFVRVDTTYEPGVEERPSRIYNMRLPFIVAKTLIGRIRAALKEVQDGPLDSYEASRCVLEISKEDREQWLDYYGIGKGQVTTEFSSPEVRAKFEAKLAEYRGRDDEEAVSFRQCVEALQAVARNTTINKDQTGVLRLHQDWAGFLFEAGAMFGGLLFHEASKTWSTHT